MVSGGTVYAGGNFTSIGAQPRNGIAALDVSSGAATDWDPNASHSVSAIAVIGGTIYVGGGFTSIGVQPQSGVAAIFSGQTVSVSGGPSIMEDVLTVAPNPARASMQIQYQVARGGRVRLELLDVSGRLEEALSDRIQAPGRHVVAWDGSGTSGRISPGIYFVRLTVPEQVAVRKLPIIR